MMAIANQFRRDGTRLIEFERRVVAYQKLRRQIESDPDVPDSLTSFLTKAAATTGLHTASDDTPAASGPLSPLEATHVADQINEERKAYLARKFRDDADIRLLTSPAHELVPLFVDGLTRVTAGLPIALFFDGYERAGPLLDRWLRGLYAGLYGDLPATLITTISGRHALSSDLWGEYLPVIADIPLKPFSETEARRFLASQDITDDRTIQVIIAASGLLPMWLATLADARPADLGDIEGSAGRCARAVPHVARRPNTTHCGRRRRPAPDA